MEAVLGRSRAFLNFSMLNLCGASSWPTSLIAARPRPIRLAALPSEECGTVVRICILSIPARRIASKSPCSPILTPNEDLFSAAFAMMYSLAHAKPIMLLAVAPVVKVRCDH